MNEQETPVSETAYDFRTENVVQMNAEQVEVELSKITGASHKHPYFNDQDRRHDAATQWRLALQQRQIDLRPQRDEGADRAELQEQLRSERRGKFDKYKTELAGLGFDVGEIPQEILDDPQDYHLDSMRRDAMIKRGQLKEVLPELRSEAKRLGLNLNPHIEQMLDHAAAMMVDQEPITRRTELDYSPQLKQVAIDAAFALHKAIATRIAE